MKPSLFFKKLALVDLKSTLKDSDPPWPTNHASVHINLTLKWVVPFFLMENVEGFKAVSKNFHSTLEVEIRKAYGGYTGLIRYQLARVTSRNNRAVSGRDSLVHIPQLQRK
jgi:hypothetical protein